MPMAVRHVHTRLGDDLHHHRVLGGPDLHGVMLHPALLGIELGKFLLADADNILLLIEKNGAGAGGTLIQGENVLAHSGNTSRR